jgi:hypothetical protein
MYRIQMVEMKFETFYQPVPKRGAESKRANENLLNSVSVPESNSISWREDSFGESLFQFL